MKAIKVTSKGQITIPVEIRLRKLLPARPLSDDDPIWDLVGAGKSGRGDISAAHDRHLAAAEIERWRGSS